MVWGSPTASLSFRLLPLSQLSHPPYLCPNPPSLLSLLWSLKIGTVQLDRTRYQLELPSPTLRTTTPRRQLELPPLPSIPSTSQTTKILLQQPRLRLPQPHSFLQLHGRNYRGLERQGDPQVKGRGILHLPEEGGVDLSLSLDRRRGREVLLEAHRGLGALSRRLSE